tara:strand:- start:219 stop:1001 length:783 start_codon:yes stop_codon:yes gene_type:complete
MKFTKKSLGQNFLIDKNIIRKIVNLINIKDKNIVEIGPGTGALTSEILKKKPKSICLIEKDENLYKKLVENYFNLKQIKVYNDDILKFDLEKKIKKKSIIFGNLPYNISSQILVKIVKFKDWPPSYTDLILMFQKELGDKILGKFKTSHYGRLSILANYKLKIVNKFLVSNNCFSPKPKVTSMVIHFQPKNNILKIKNIANLEKVSNILFSNKRKMIKKNIGKILSRPEIDKVANLELSNRPSDIKPEIYYKITEIYEKT